MTTARTRERRHFFDRFTQLFVALCGGQVYLLAALADVLHLTGLEICFGEDLSVHLDQNLLKDF